jgi:hypothetical protein
MTTPSPRISILFDSNAKSVAKQVKDLENVLSDINRKGSGRRRAVSGQSRTAIGAVAEQINRADMTRPGSQNVIRAASQAGLGTQLEATATMAGTMIGGVLGKELQQGIGYLVNENMRPIKQAIARLREQAASSTSPAIAANITQTADDLQAQLSAYQELAVSRKSALQSLQEPKVLENLERVRSQYNRLGLDVGSIGDLGKFASQLSTISPGVAGSISMLTANVENLDPQEYTKQFQRIASEGLKQVDSQKRELEAAIQRQTSRSDRRMGTSFTRVFEDRFGKIADFLSGAATFDKSSLPNQMAMSVFRDQIKATAPSSIRSQLDARNISQLQALASARAGGDPAQVATALVAAEKAIQRRIRAVQEDLTKLTKIAEASGDNDLKAAINQLRVTANEAQQKLLNQVTGAQRSIQTGMMRQLDASLKTFTDSVSGAGGDRAGITTRQGLLEYNNRLTGYIGDLFQATNKSFANVQFQSLGGQSLAQLFPGKGGGLGAKANFLTNQVLAPTGFFKEATAEGRISALGQAVDQVEPKLKALGLSGQELADASEQLRAVLLRVMKSYEPVISTANRLNAVQFEAARARAERAIATGDYAGARAAITDLQNYTTTTVPTSRKAPLTTEAQMTAQVAGDLSPKGLINYEENIDRIERDIERAQNRANRDGLFTRLGRFAGRALSIFGGLQFAIGGTAQAIGTLVEQANALDRAAATVNALSGSFKGFNQVLTLAATQQAKFGGTLEQNLQGFNSLIPISKRYGADLLQLDNIARRLAVIDPLQGFAGASIALKEFFSGDITSLSRRFEIDRKTLNSIKDAGGQLEQLQKLDEVLADLGISNAVLEARTQTTAATYDQFGATLSNFTTLVGKRLQGGFEGLVLAMTNSLDVTNTLNEALANEQAYINLSTNIERVSRKINMLQTETEKIENPLTKYTGDFVNLDALVDKNAKSVSELVDEWNSLIIELNRLRALEGKPLLALFSQQDTQLIQDLVALSNRTGISVMSLLEGRDPITGQMLSTEQTFQQASGQVAWWEEALANLFAYETENVRRRNDIAALAGRPGGQGGLAGIRQFTDPLFLAEKYFSEQSMNRVQEDYGIFGGLIPMVGFDLQKNLDKVAPAYLEQLQAQTKALDTNTGFYEAQARVLEEQTGINYAETAAEYQRQLQSGELSQEEANAIVLKLIELNKKLLEVTEERVRYESDYITQNLATASSFGGQALNESLVGRINQITQDNASVAQQIISQMYLGLGGGASAAGMSPQLRALVKSAEEMYGLTREQLYYMSQLERRQAKLTLEANKSVSAYGALNAQMSGMQITLQDAVRLAMEFNEGVQGIVSGTMLGQLSLDDRLRFFQGEYSNPMSMQNQSDVLGNLDSILGLILEKEQERLDLAAEEKNLAQERAEEARKADEDRVEYEKDRNDLIKDAEKDRVDLQKDYEDKKLKLLEDYEEKKTDLVEDFEKKKLQAILDAQLSVKENRTDFFSALIGAETLTEADRNRFTGEYDKLVEEAARLREGGSFEAAEQVLRSGLELLTNQINLLDQLNQSQEELAETSKQLTEITKTSQSGIFGTGLSKEKDKLEEDSKNLQEEIARLEQRIKDLKVLQQLQYDEDLTRLEQARKLRDKEKTEFKDMLDEMNDDYKKSLGEMDEDYKKSLTEREADFKESLTTLDDEFQKNLNKQKDATIEAEKAQIISFDDMMKFRQAGYIAMEAARLAAEGGNREDIQKQLSGQLSSVKDYFSQRNTPAARAILEALTKLETLPPGIQQGFNPAIASAIGTSTQNNPYLEEMLRAGVSKEDMMAAPAIAPFQAALISNTGELETNTSAIKKSTEAIKRLGDILEKRPAPPLNRPIQPGSSAVG